MQSQWQSWIVAALFGCGVGAAASEVVALRFEQPETVTMHGTAQSVPGKPGNGKALFFPGDVFAEMPATAALKNAEKKGVMTVECWILREEDDLNGFMMRQDGAFSLMVVPWDPTRVNLGIWTAAGYVSLDTEPCLRAAFWQHIAFTVDGTEVRLYVDGKLQLSHTMKAPMLVSEQPLYLAGAINEGQFIGGLESGLDEVLITDTVKSADYFNQVLARCTENFDATQQQIGMPPVIHPAKNTISAATPVVVRRDADAVTAENSYYRLELGTANGLMLRRLVNKYGDAECLTRAGTPLFAVALDGKTLPAAAFQVNSVAEEKTADGVRLTFELVDPALQLAMKLFVSVDSTRDIGIDYALTNDGAARRIQVTAPLLENISIGPDFEENYYFWPVLTGWVGKKSYELGMAYDSRCWIQLTDVFSPELGIGLALSGRDTTGTVKGIVVRKTRKNGKIGVNYNINFLPMMPMVSPFAADGVGSAMAHVFLPRELAAGATLELPPSVISVHPGDVLTPLADYRTWLDTWFKHDPMPASIRDDFNMVAVHRKVGNRGFEKGFGQTPGKISLVEYMQPDGRDHQLQLAMWWQEHTPGRIASGEGDYEYCDAFGGLEGLKRGIQEAADKGAKVSLYLCSRQAGDDSEIAQFEDQAFYPKPNERANDWGSFNPCTHAYKWQDLLVSKYARLAHDLPVAGLYLDTSAEVLLCANPGHPHAPNLIDDQIRLLTKVREAIKTAKPDAFFFTEFMGSEFFGQYIDACWIQTFANPHAAVFNNYDLDFARFVLPQVKFFEWGMNDRTFEVDSRRIFFNGVGGGRGDLNDGQNTRYADLTNTLREVGPTLATPTPQPFYPGKTERLYVNCFPGETVNAWTLYNKTGAAFDGAAFAAPEGNRRYVELLHDTMPEVKDGVVSLALAQDEVGLVAGFTPVMEVIDAGDTWAIELLDGYRDDMKLVWLDAPRDSQEFERELPVTEHRARLEKSQVKGDRVILKLKTGHTLADQMVLQK